MTAFLDKNSLTVPLFFLLKPTPHQSLLESLRTFVRQSGCDDTHAVAVASGRSS